ncbi:MAG: helix-turn-helix domain-containing protein [Planctomycetaceae bacterium]|nr:helix-turn-helix domain-containing protein [Planctomycetaceae bacterium]
MLRISISASDLATIQYERYYHSDPHIIKRMTILALHSEGETMARIAQLAGVNIKTVSRCLHSYQKGGLEAVTNTTYINSNSVCEMLRKLAKKHVGQKIVIVLDTQPTNIAN